MTFKIKICAIYAYLVFAHAFTSTLFSDKLRTTTARSHGVTSNQSHRPVPTVAAKATFTRSKSLSQKSDVSKNVSKAYLFSKMTPGRAQSEEEPDSPTEPTEFSLYAEARLFNNRNKVKKEESDNDADDDIREDVSEAGTYVIDHENDNELIRRSVGDEIDVEDIDDFVSGGTLGIIRPIIDSGLSTPQGNDDKSNSADQSVNKLFEQWGKVSESFLMASTDALAGSVAVSKKDSEVSVLYFI